MSTTHIPKSLRARVSAQAHRRCGYCLTTERVIGAPMEIEHILPEALGGATTEDNLWLACSLCNQHKGSRIAAIDPETGDLVPLFDPRRQTWSQHFTWSNSATVIAGISPIGRATVVALHLNRASLVLARREWVVVGWHPPVD